LGRQLYGRVVRRDLERAQRVCDRPQPQRRLTAAGETLRAATKSQRELRSRPPTTILWELCGRTARCLSRARLLRVAGRGLRAHLLRTGSLLWSSLGLARMVRFNSLVLPQRLPHGAKKWCAPASANSPPRVDPVRGPWNDGKWVASQ